MGNRLSKIYTRTGDQGETGIGDGRRVLKDHPRIETIGEVDTLNCQLGVLLAGLQAEQAQNPALTEIIDALQPCQHRLFDIGGELAMPDYQVINAEEISRVEAIIDEWNEELGPLKEFILPGGSILIAQAHLARSVARTAERRALTLHQVEPLRAEILKYLNRLSDLLFVGARIIARRQDKAEVLWQSARLKG